MSDLSRLGGWVNDPVAVNQVSQSLPMPRFNWAAPQLRGTGAGKTTLLYKAWKDALGSYFPYRAQTIGDCVSHGHGHGVDLLQAVQISLGKQHEKWEETATEAIYGMARVDIGQGQLGNQDGAVGAWAAKAISTLGTVDREVVGVYDGQRAKLWGNSGVPQSIHDAAPAHKVGAVSLIQKYSDLEDALANGYPVTVCSNQGFTMTRDQQGFCQPQGSWSHCMLIVGTRVDRPGACIFQSWGMSSPSGPVDLDQPPNSFWADRDTVETMLSMGDSWSLSTFNGYPDQTLPDHWTYEDASP